MNKPLVSVIIPIYNMQDFIAQTIDSVLNSTYPNMELILMDDGSKDSSPEIAKAYLDKDKRVKFFSQANGGASSARNNAISNA
jgi:glycosyltransferase involved in cell wall biosynthesis